MGVRIIRPATARSLVVATIITLFVFFYRWRQNEAFYSSDLELEESTFSIDDNSSSSIPITDIPKADVDLVVASLKHENTSWYKEYFPQWRQHIYVVDDPNALLTVKENKGREAMVYLSYIIDNYDTLASNVLFVHAQRFQWHNDDPDYDSLPLLQRFQFPYLQRQGYVNLRCAWVLGCPTNIRPFHDAQTEPDKNGKVQPSHIYKKAFEELFPDWEVPEAVGASCCAQFAASRKQIHMRPKEEYEGYRKWILSTSLDDGLSGRVLEYSWHMIFGQKAIHCPSASDCYCNVYGMCDLECTDDQCDGRYVLPPFSVLPEGWPKIGWDRKPRNYSGPL